jgi:hypothetical protein
VNSTQPAQDAGQAASEQHSAPGDLARHGIDYARAWSELFTSEAQLARQSAQRLLVATVCICALLPGAVIVCNVLAASMFHRWFDDWASSLALTLLLNFLVLLGLAVSIRGWWRNLSLPRSRRALCELAERMK